ncbi:MAG: ABC transporter ATP-binding protein [Nitrospirae bacterium GWC2_46_6]|nr:MAG: ABC transporter ATP-binding protein [Nitrospirae bacterium GWC2_46_6]OGW21915.1 MAG: ABC transporter ATP-binding protein [Nitrospirae bacterium GWA2_46_11]OGW24425.1 MAG: ABC transporter ATP-binding protein [Nitrospirae bacterium GWB2_47_37]HAK89496.1 ABC transporter ATP-binding protein [Nitrospiraceae bacterium]HCL80737.1 ABC transporter ATP-binding protein [Nitrospiraceae bacterium]
MTPIITVENLTKKFGSITAVDGISFEVREGTIFGFLGPNGAGKTTTINILCTLLSPTSGNAAIDGHDCMKESSEVRKNIGIVFQDNTLDKELTAYENLLFHSYLYNVPKNERKKRINDALNFVGLYERKDEPVKRFSGGMKRRLEVARSIIHQPKVLFLDEPTLGLDPQSRTNLWEFISELPKKHDVTIFMTTHYMEEAEICDKIAIIDKGKIIAQGSPEELKKMVGGDVIYLKTRNNVAAIDVIKTSLNLDAEEKNGEIFISVSKGDACIPKLINTLADAVVSVRLQRPTLNDVFLKLTGKAMRPEAVSGGDELKESIRSYRKKFDRG